MDGGRRSLRKSVRIKEQASSSRLSDNAPRNVSDIPKPALGHEFCCGCGLRFGRVRNFRAHLRLTSKKQCFQKIPLRRKQREALEEKQSKLAPAILTPPSVSQKLSLGSEIKSSASDNSLSNSVSNILAEWNEDDDDWTASSPKRPRLETVDTSVPSIDKLGLNAHDTENRCHSAEDAVHLPTTESSSLRESSFVVPESPSDGKIPKLSSLTDSTPVMGDSSPNAVLGLTESISLSEVIPSVAESSNLKEDVPLLVDTSSEMKFMSSVVQSPLFRCDKPVMDDSFDLKDSEPVIVHCGEVTSLSTELSSLRGSELRELSTLVPEVCTLREELSVVNKSISADPESTFTDQVIFPEYSLSIETTRAAAESPPFREAEVEVANSTLPQDVEAEPSPLNEHVCVVTDSSSTIESSIAEAKNITMESNKVIHESCNLKDVEQSDIISCSFSKKDPHGVSECSPLRDDAEKVEGVPLGEISSIDPKSSPFTDTSCSKPESLSFGDVTSLSNEDLPPTILSSVTDSTEDIKLSISNVKKTVPDCTSLLPETFQIPENNQNKSLTESSTSEESNISGSSIKVPESPETIKDSCTSDLAIAAADSLSSSSPCLNQPLSISVYKPTEDTCHSSALQQLASAAIEMPRSPITSSCQSKHSSHALLSPRNDRVSGINSLVAAAFEISDPHSSISSADTITSLQLGAIDPQKPLSSPKQRSCFSSPRESSPSILSPKREVLKIDSLDELAAVAAEMSEQEESTSIILDKEVPPLMGLQELAAAAMEMPRSPVSVPSSRLLEISQTTPRSPLKPLPSNEGLDVSITETNIKTLSCQEPTKFKMDLTKSLLISSAKNNSSHKKNINEPSEPSLSGEGVKPSVPGDETIACEEVEPSPVQTFDELLPGVLDTSETSSSQREDTQKHKDVIKQEVLYSPKKCVPQVSSTQENNERWSSENTFSLLSSDSVCSKLKVSDSPKTYCRIQVVDKWIEMEKTERDASLDCHVVSVSNKKIDVDMGKEESFVKEESVFQEAQNSLSLEQSSNNDILRPPEMASITDIGNDSNIQQHAKIPCETTSIIQSLGSQEDNLKTLLPECNKLNNPCIEDNALSKEREIVSGIECNQSSTLTSTSISHMLLKDWEEDSPSPEKKTEDISNVCGGQPSISDPVHREVKKEQNDVGERDSDICLKETKTIETVKQDGIGVSKDSISPSTDPCDEFPEKVKNTDSVDEEYSHELVRGKVNNNIQGGNITCSKVVPTLVPPVKVITVPAEDILSTAETKLPEWLQDWQEEVVCESESPIKPGIPTLSDSSTKEKLVALNTSTKSVLSQGSINPGSREVSTEVLIQGTSEVYPGGKNDVSLETPTKLIDPVILINPSLPLPLSLNNKKDVNTSQTLSEMDLDSMPLVFADDSFVVPPIPMEPVHPNLLVKAALPPPPVVLPMSDQSLSTSLPVLVPAIPVLMQKDSLSQNSTISVELVSPKAPPRSLNLLDSTDPIVPSNRLETSTISVLDKQCPLERKADLMLSSKHTGEADQWSSPASVSTSAGQVKVLGLSESVCQPERNVIHIRICPKSMVKEFMNESKEKSRVLLLPGKKTASVNSVKPFTTESKVSSSLTLESRESSQSEPKADNNKQLVKVNQTTRVRQVAIGGEYPFQWGENLVVYLSGNNDSPTTFFTREGGRIQVPVPKRNSHVKVKVNRQKRFLVVLPDIPSVRQTALQIQVPQLGQPSLLQSISLPIRSPASSPLPGMPSSSRERMPLIISTGQFLRSPRIIGVRDVLRSRAPRAEPLIIRTSSDQAKIVKRDPTQDQSNQEQTIQVEDSQESSSGESSITQQRLKPHIIQRPIVLCSPSAIANAAKTPKK